MTTAVNTQESSKTSSSSSQSTQTGSSGSSMMPPFLQAVDQMVSTMDEMMNSYVQYANQSTVAAMAESNANTSNAIQNLNTINGEMVNAENAESKAQTWGTIGSICGDILGLCLMPFDPALGMTLLLASASGQLHITQDVVGWISDGVEDVMPNLTSEESQALADVILVVSVVIVAVVLGALTAGTADVAIADVAAEDAGRRAAVDITEDAAKNVVGDVADDIAGNVAEDIGSDVAKDTVTDAGAAATDPKKTESGSKRGKRAIKFAKMVGAQAMMQTDLLPNIVKAVASVSNDPDSQSWKYAELAAFVAEIGLSIGLSISGALTEAPGIGSAKISESSQASLRSGVKSGAMNLGLSEGTADTLGKGSAKLAASATSIARNAALVAGLAEGTSSAVAGAYSTKTAHIQFEMSSEVENLTLEKVGTDIINTNNEAIQKEEAKAEQELFDHNFASFADGGATISEQMA